MNIIISQALHNFFHAAQPSFKLGLLSLFTVVSPSILLIPGLKPTTLFQGLFYSLLLLFIPIILYILGLISQRGLDLENTSRISEEAALKSNALTKKDNKIRELQKNYDDLKLNNNNLRSENHKLSSKNDALDSQVKNLDRINKQNQKEIRNLQEENRLMLSNTNYTERKNKIIQEVKSSHSNSSVGIENNIAMESSQVSMAVTPLSSKIPTNLVSASQITIPNIKIRFKEREDDKNVSTNN